MTVTVTVQLLFAAIVAPLTPTVVEVWLAVPAVHVVAALAACVVTPAGKVSVNAAPVRATAFELPNVIVSVLVPPAAIVVGLKALTTVGGVSALTLSVADVGVVLEPPFVVVTAPAGIVFT